MRPRAIFSRKFGPLGGRITLDHILLWGLDITLDLRSSSYKPFMKPENTPLDVNYDHNHPPSILRGSPDAINKRLSNVSSDRRSFVSDAPSYQEALKKAVSIITSITTLSHLNRNAMEIGTSYGSIHLTVSTEIF